MTADPLSAGLKTALEREYQIETVVQETPGEAIYLARDRTLNRRVTIRVIDPAVGGSERVEEFRRQARIRAALSHPCIAAVHHAGAIEGYLFVVAEHPGPEPLEKRLQAGPLPAAEVVRLGVDLLGALEAVHSAGMTHRAVTAGHIALSEGRYVLDGFVKAGAAAEGQGIGHDLEAAARLLLRASGRTSPEHLPPPLRLALSRALQADLGQRWTTAAEFRAALEKPPRHRFWEGRAGWIAAALVLVMVAWYVRKPTDGPRDGPVVIPRELAVVPFEIDGGLPLDPLGSNLAHLVQLNLDNLPGLELASRRQMDRWWKDQAGDALGIDWAEAARDFRVHWVAHGLVDRRPGDLLRVRLTLYDSLGAKNVLPEVRGSADDLAALGDSVTLQIIRVVTPRADSLYEPMVGLSAAPLPALKAFLRGEAAFAQDAWAQAQQSYEMALTHDSTFALAEWRLANVKQWRRLPYQGDLRSVYRRHADRFRPRDRVLIEALLEPDLEIRFTKLEQAIGNQPSDGYARLLQGEELFHRGPLVGRGLEQAVSAMTAAVTRDPSLALAHDHLVLAATRLGRREDAMRALDRRRAVGTSARADDLDLLPFLELVYDERFVPWRAWLRYRYVAWREDPRQLGGIEKVARMGTPWLDMPHTQLRYCGLLLSSGKPSAETSATAHEGKGLAFFALGRLAEAFAEIDSAAALIDSPEARLQQAEWRILPGTLGLPGVNDADSHQQLQDLARDPVVGPRAIWALAMAAQSAGDAALARRWSGQLPSDSPLRALLDAREAAAHGDLALALARSDSARLAFRVTRPPDAFAGAAFHLLRGDWFLALGDRVRADAEWLWYEASDVEGWPTGLAQAGEVDGALGVLARFKRARALLVNAAHDGETVQGCGHIRRVVQLWAGADPALQPLIQEASALAGRCPK